MPADGLLALGLGTFAGRMTAFAAVREDGTNQDHDGYIYAPTRPGREVLQCSVTPRVGYACDRVFRGG